MRLRLLIMSILAALTLIGCGPEEQPDGPAKEYAPYKTGDLIQLKSIHGTSKTLKRTEKGFVLVGEEDKVLMIDAFGTFCQPCKEEANHLMEFQLKNNEKLVLIGLTHLENVSDQHVLDQFASQYNAYYFMVNDVEQNNRLIAALLRDIAYRPVIQLPFKFVLKNGEYQTLTDVWEGTAGVKYYLGKVDIAVMQKDLDRITGVK